MKRTLHRGWRLGFGWPALLTLGLAPLHAADEPVIMLPPLEVSAALQTTPWRYAEIPGLEILSSCADSTTRAFIEAEHRIDRLFAALVPDEFQVRLAVPKIVVLSEQKRTLTASQDLVAGFGATGNVGAKGSGALPARAASVRFMPNLRLADPDSIAVFAVIDESKFNPDQMGLTPDHVRFVLEHRTPPLPAWFVDGFAILSTKMIFSRDGITFTAADWMSPQETEPLRTDANAPRTLLSMRELLEEKRPADNAPADASRRWRAQASLFLRWAFDGDEARRKAFWKFVARATDGPINEEAFQQCFRESYADARDRLSDYLPIALRNPVRFIPGEIPPLADYKLRLATDAEVGRLKGDWERLEISFVRSRFPQYVTRYEEQAARTLTKSYAIDSRDPRLLAILGLHACDVGKDEQAYPMLETAAQAGVVRPRVYFELARLRYIQALANPNGANGLLGAAQVNAILEPLRTAHEQLPPLAQSYALAAEVWSRSEVRLSRQHFALLDEGLKLFPRQLTLLYQVAVLKFRQGANAEAAALIDRGLELSPTPASRAGFEKLQIALGSGG